MPEGVPIPMHIRTAQTELNREDTKLGGTWGEVFRKSCKIMNADMIKYTVYMYEVIKQ